VIKLKAVEKKRKRTSIIKKKRIAKWTSKKYIIRGRNLVRRAREREIERERERMKDQEAKRG